MVVAMCPNCHTDKYLYGLAVGQVDHPIPYCSRCGERVYEETTNKVVVRRNCSGVFPTKA